MAVGAGALNDESVASEDEMVLDGGAEVVEGEIILTAPLDRVVAEALVEVMNRVAGAIAHLPLLLQYSD